MPLFTPNRIVTSLYTFTLASPGTRSGYHANIQGLFSGHVILSALSAVVLLPMQCVTCEQHLLCRRAFGGGRGPPVRNRSHTLSVRWIRLALMGRTVIEMCRRTEAIPGEWTLKWDVNVIEWGCTTVHLLKALRFYIVFCYLIWCPKVSGSKKTSDCSHWCKVRERSNID